MEIYRKKQNEKSVYGNMAENTIYIIFPTMKK